ncbi:hypothetical protein [Streptomyces sp. 900105245]
MEAVFSAYWLQALTELKNCGAEDVVLLVCGEDLAAEGGADLRHSLPAGIVSRPVTDDDVESARSGNDYGLLVGSDQGEAFSVQ